MSLVQFIEILVIGSDILILNVLSQKGERCLCNTSFVGQSCQLGLHDDGGAGQWWRVSDGNPYTPPRTGSAGMYLSSTGALYLFGGESGMFFLMIFFYCLVNKHHLLHMCCMLMNLHS